MASWDHTSRARRCSFTTLPVTSALILKYIGQHGLLPEARQDRAAKKKVVGFYLGRARKNTLMGSYHWLKEERVKSLAEDLLRPPVPKEERLRGFTRLEQLR